MTAMTTPTAPAPVLEVRELAKRFRLGGGLFQPARELRAVDGVSFAIARGQTLALVGESGCGKSTVANLVMQLLAPSGGEILVGGRPVQGRHGAREAWRHMQMVFQDPYASLNPRMTALDIVAEPLVNFAVGDAGSRRERARALLERVSLPASMHQRYPHEFSGGQRQRLGIARALALEPSLIVADEPVSALDVSVQAQILNLLAGLKRERGMAYLFVSHDLGVVEYIADAVAVMYLGRIVEQAPRQRFFAQPLHPYARALIEAVPRLDPHRRRPRELLQGDVPSAAALPSGCRFRTRCPLVQPRCAEYEPALTELAPQHFVACHVVADTVRQPHPGPQGTPHQET